MSTTKSDYSIPELPTVEGAHPDRNILDAARLSVAKTIAAAWDVDVAKVFPAVDFGKKGADLAVAIPRFFKGSPDEHGAKVVESVSITIPALALILNPVQSRLAGRCCQANWRLPLL